MLTWSPFAAGHMAQETISAGSSSTISLRPYSYNYVGIFPAWLVVDNLRNQKSVTITASSGLSHTIPPATSKAIMIGTYDAVSIDNSNNSLPVICTLFDRRSKKEMIDDFEAALIAPPAIDYIALNHFDTTIDNAISDGRLVYVNSGASLSSAEYKFGVGSLEVAGGGSYLLGPEREISILKSFAMDYWLKTKPGFLSGYLFFYENGKATSIRIAVDTPTRLKILYTLYNSTEQLVGYLDVSNSANPFPIFTHIAVESNLVESTSGYATKLILYVSGVSKSMMQGTSPLDYPVLISKIGLPPGAVPGWYDELRIVTYSPYLSSNFTPPTVPYE